MDFLLRNRSQTGPVKRAVSPINGLASIAAVVTMLPYRLVVSHAEPSTGYSTDVFYVPSDCTAPSSSQQASQQEESFLVSSLVSPCPATKVCDVLSSKVLSSSPVALSLPSDGAPLIQFFFQMLFHGYK